MVKTLNVHCPQCKGVLEVDTASGKVLRHWKSAPDGKPIDLLEKAAELRAREGEQLDVEGGVKKLEERRKAAEDAFEQAKQKAQQDAADGKDLKPPEFF